jgi:chromosome segregation ATPase
MKKNTFFAIVIMLMMSVSALAQSNSYNMVIEMANGTKINIGPNDVKNIYFKDGELVVSGENLEKLIQNTNENMNQTTTELSILNARLQNVESRIDVLSNQSGGASSDEIKNIQAQIAGLKEVINVCARKDDVAEMMQKMDASNKYLSDMININAKDIMDLKNEIKNQTTQIVQLKSITDAMMNQIYELQARMSVLENALENKQ